MLSFEKWHGLGNDFILVEQRLSAEQAAQLCDRRRGIGADGVLQIGERNGVPSMAVLNADGSRPEMCGNGLRCVAGYLASRRPELETIRIETEAGPRVCQLAREAGGWQVEASMGKARSVGNLRFPAEDGPSFVLIDVGNPHAVSFDVYGDEALGRLGPALQHQLAGRVNVELCRMRADGGIDVLVWERGVGKTQACGTGACAVAAAAARAQRIPYGQPVMVHLPGGPLHITVNEADQALSMRGPARHVFSGELVVDWPPAPAEAMLAP